MASQGNWQDIAAQKQAERAAKIPKEWIVPSELYKNLSNVMTVPETCGILTNEELEITSKYDATALVEKLRDGSLTAEAVTVAFCKRAAIAQQLTNCLTEIFFEEGIARAKELDAQRAQDPSKPLPPLWGLPISLKDSFQVPGYDASCGIVSLANDPSQVYSNLPKILLDLGAVLYVKTNIPQTLMTADSDNNIFGRTINPHNSSLTAGGSSGGEGALIALRGSILGVGTDVAGSVRIPALCNGIYTLKPSMNVVPYGGQRRISVPGTDGVKAVAGPMATSIRDCELFMRVVTTAKPWEQDSALNRTIWQGVKTPLAKDVIIGLVEDYGFVTPHPPVRRALAESAAKLERAGIKVVPVSLPDVGVHYADLFDFFRAPGNATIQAMMEASGEPEVPSVKRIGLTGGVQPPYELPEYLRLFVAQEEAKTKTREVFLKHNLDAIISPGAAHVATPHDLYQNAAFTGLWNYVDHPTTIVPVGKVEPTDLPDENPERKYGEQDDAVTVLYTSPADYKDAPTAIQVIGKRQHDEELLAVTALIDAALKA